MRHFKSGMVGIARGQIGRLNVVNIAAPGSLAKPFPVTMGWTANPRSERLEQSTFTLEPGMSVFLDVDGDAIAAGVERRHEVRAEVAVDLDCACVVTLEVVEGDGQDHGPDRSCRSAGGRSLRRAERRRKGAGSPFRITIIA